MVGDDGVGFDEADRERGLGLDGMHERAAIHGGTVDIRSRRGTGTRVEIVIPLSSSVVSRVFTASGAAIGSAR
jgi:signal transduction histidine kinase